MERTITQLPFLTIRPTVPGKKEGEAITLLLKTHNGYVIPIIINNRNICGLLTDIPVQHPPQRPPHESLASWAPMTRLKTITDEGE